MKSKWDGIPFDVMKHFLTNAQPGPKIKECSIESLYARS